jgi:anti-sigma regulatory factor (Ser/Thr protein kinase)
LYGLNLRFALREKIVLPASLDSIPRAVGFVREYLSRRKLDSLDKFAIVVEEIFSNIANYAYKDVRKDVELICDYLSNSGECVITFVDSGIEYNPLNTPEPDVTLPLEKRKIGGLGIFIVKKFMDRIDYERKGNENILTLVKKLR